MSQSVNCDCLSEAENRVYGKLEEPLKDGLMKIRINKVFDEA